MGFFGALFEVVFELSDIFAESRIDSLEEKARYGQLTEREEYQLNHLSRVVAEKEARKAEYEAKRNNYDD